MGEQGHHPKPARYEYKSGTSWILDVGIICPGSQRLVGKGTDTIPGKAAALYEDKKTKTHSDHANFVPFIVKTGGRINAAGLQFLSRIPVGGRGHGWTYAEAWTCCTARHLTGTGASAGLHACIDCRGDTRA